MGETESAIAAIISALAKRLGREPTEDEVYNFIMGDSSTQNYIWNKENN
ncbi:hypothetical protein SEA_ODESZA_66 [Gordonia Phage Odesza]|uniref:Uncharacterized protein n=6 Tax=Tanisvirus TaxID=2843069 RepID=A0A7D5FSG8_9CAUD|nr:hypothetical protein HWC73_gp67 [Gordonia phage Tanis]YP_009853634.1 hypothetical protein HWC78_gp68 [Gordonia phage Avazak]AVO25306.1 hypothetical protein PBI_GRAVY_66 [Gordonia phage Gravy]AVO25399.1 hypothetical protein PBI_KERRY_66 [Gordonia phage Kerry]QGJ89677.1 hypothetical protein SEA_ODESZA_66 [Gordonia Phage Odesza]QKY78738.1 hypothetical protein SEA_GILL_67 [Gordonia phage Gill]QLF83784.1 hypothetical protein SEA_MAGEL_68 [Gordonia phage Magel]QYW00706.1 hypothetical protein SE